MTNEHLNPVPLLTILWMHINIEIDRRSIDQDSSWKNRDILRILSKQEKQFMLYSKVIPFIDYTYMYL